MRLNKYISNSGICSRRKADFLIKSGEIKVNGNIMNEFGYNVSDNDVVEYKNKKVTLTKEYTYLILNKPSNCITTTYDPQHRRTVFDLLPEFRNERLFPVGRLDRNTTGLLLLTNDGSLARKLMHPSSNIVKKYSIKLNKDLSFSDLLKIKKGIKLSDGFFKVDKINIDKENHKHVSIEMHSGKNRILRRLFDSFGYRIMSLDRFFYAGFSKENLKIGEYKKIKI